jgi:hypothetical protein
MENDIKTPLEKLLKYILNKNGDIPLPTDDELTRIIEDLEKVQLVALQAAELLEEVRTGEDFECVCGEKADEMRKALGMKGLYED